MDYDTYQKYLKTGVISGLKFFFCIKEADGQLVFNKNSGACPYETKEGLCGIQLKYGEDYLCEVCATYPRLTYNYGFHAEEYLDLSCPSVVKLLLEDDSADLFVTGEKEIHEAPYGTNEDPIYLNLLDKIRNQIYSYIIFSSEEVPVIAAKLIKLGNEIQKSFIEERCEYVDEGYADRIFKITDDILKKSEDDPGLQGASNDKVKVDESIKIYPDYQVIDRIIRGGFYHIRLKNTSPFLYKLCKYYFSQFGGKNVRANEEKFRAISESFFEDAFLNKTIRKYLGYRIATTFTTAYDDFNFLRKISIPIVESQLLMIFIWLFENNEDKANINNMCDIISVFTRRSGHRESAGKELFLEAYEDIIAPII